MRKINFTLIVIILIQSFLLAQNNDELYLGQIPPKNIAIPFHLGDFLDTEYNSRRSFNFTFSPDGKEMFFSYIKTFDDSPNPEFTYQIKTSEYKNNEWTLPKLALFSYSEWNVDINFSPDGKYVFFASEIMYPDSFGADIYYCEKCKNGWSKPMNTMIPNNEIGDEVYPSLSRKNNMFFRSTRNGGYGESDLYRVEWRDKKFINLQNLGPNINTEYGESNSVISPDESYILFVSSRENDGGDQQIYISFQIGENIWTKAQKLPPFINSGSTGAPTITTDGKYLFFRNNKRVKWISTDFIIGMKTN